MGRCWPDVGRCWPKRSSCGHHWSNSAEFDHMLVDTGQHRPKFEHRRPTMVEFVRCWPTSRNMWPNSTNADQRCSKFGQTTPANNRPTSASIYRLGLRFGSGATDGHRLDICSAIVGHLFGNLGGSPGSPGHFSGTRGEQLPGSCRVVYSLCHPWPPQGRRHHEPNIRRHQHRYDPAPRFL